VRDDALIEIAAQAPKSTKELARTRGLSNATAEGRMGAGLLEAVAQGLACPPDQRPQAPPRRVLPPGIGPIVELLRVLLKMTCEEAHVAQKLVASTADLEEIAADDDADVPALRGWRREVFGAAALQLKHGKIGLTINGKRAQVIPTESTGQSTGTETASPPQAAVLQQQT
jgi:ribonuclease D